MEIIFFVCSGASCPEQNFAQELDDREEVDEVEEEDESVYPVKELVRAQDPPGSMRTGQGKMFKVSAPASTITVGSVCSTTSSRGTLVILLFFLPFFSFLFSFFSFLSLALLDRKFSFHVKKL